jgi:hypothetical protein
MKTPLPDVNPTLAYNSNYCEADYGWTLDCGIPSPHSTLAVHMNIIRFFGKLLALIQSRQDLHFVLYTRTGCHLCEVAWRELSTAQERYQFVLEKKDVDSDPELAARFGDCIPVVTVNGKVRFRGAVNPVLLRRLLQSGVRSQESGVRNQDSEGS